MTPRNLARLAFVLVGIGALIAAVPSMQGLFAFPFMRSPELRHPVLVFLGVLVPTALQIGAALGLIVRRKGLAQWLYPEVEDIKGAESGQGLEELAFGVLGLYLALSSLPSLASLAAVLSGLNWEMDATVVAGAFRGNLAYAAGVLAQFAGGLALFLFSPSVASWWRRRVAARGSRNVRRRFRCPSCGHPFDPNDYRAEGQPLCSRCHAPLAKEVFMMASLAGDGQKEESTTDS